MLLPEAPARLPNLMQNRGKDEECVLGTKIQSECRGTDGKVLRSLLTLEEEL